MEDWETPCSRGCRRKTSRFTSWRYGAFPTAANRRSCSKNSAFPRHTSLKRSGARCVDAGPISVPDLLRLAIAAWARAAAESAGAAATESTEARTAGLIKLGLLIRGQDLVESGIRFPI